MPQTWYLDDYHALRDFAIGDLGLAPVDHGGGHFTICNGEITVHAEDRKRGVMPSIYLVGDAGVEAAKAFKALKKRFGAPKKTVLARTLERMQKP